MSIGGDPKVHQQRVLGGEVLVERAASWLEAGGRWSQEWAARRNAIIYFHDGEKVTVVASNAGSARNPAW
jgi:F420H(2)-dependent quinone reductase